MSDAAPKVLIASAFPESKENFLASQARAWFQNNPPSRWQMVEAPEAAELILFLEHHPGNDPLFLRVWLHPWRRRWPQKCWLYHDADHVFPLMDGVYPSLEKNVLPNGTLASWIYVTQFCLNEAVQHSPIIGDEPYLYSFSGAARTHPVRKEILKIRDERAWLQDTSHQNGWELNGEEQANYHQKYARILRESKFVLCPRGISPTSYRLLEAMKTGRAPVIISDDWHLPKGINWSEFAIVLREAEAPGIPRLLREREDEAMILGRAARLTWEKFCADDTKYAQLIEQFLVLARSRAKFQAYDLARWFHVLKSVSGQKALWRSLKSLTTG